MQGSALPLECRRKPRNSYSRHCLSHSIVTGAVIGTVSGQRFRRMPHAPLPHGIDPVQAGRFGLWLLSVRSQRAAQKRIAFPERVRKQSLNSRVQRLIAPWYVYEYPGATVIISHICGIARSTAQGWINGKRLPPKHARKLADYLERHASECDALARELRVYAERRGKP